MCMSDTKIIPELLTLIKEKSITNIYVYNILEYILC